MNIYIPLKLNKFPSYVKVRDNPASIYIPLKLNKFVQTMVDKRHGMHIYIPLKLNKFDTDEREDIKLRFEFTFLLS